jgi:hypothetical protein
LFLGSVASSSSTCLVERRKNKKYGEFTISSKSL